MPVSPTYPGVYIEEVPSGVRTITGVSTSVTAFAGSAKRGPVNKATRVLNYSDFERRFGGLSSDSEMSYAVRQFFLNGGSEAWIVRLAYNAGAASETLDNISSDLLDQIMGLLRQSLGTLQEIFAAKTNNDGISERDPQKLALILWALFSGLVLWEESKRALDPRKDFLKPTLDMAFEVFGRGLTQSTRKEVSESINPKVETS